ncbi:hypothetical protein [Candidatus Uabimicrobium sp. HlEnr_7]|uniref:hypothetical protein n=1 Tax=Candidatus Uabimicrobium helgolandensis TaxID=3095367 RepID=UPI003557EBDE
MNSNPKYSILEIERRWLVNEAKLPDLEYLVYFIIEDLYIDNSRLRLRKMYNDKECIYKLGKKYGKTSIMSEPIVNIYLSRQEYEMFCGILSGKKLARKRYKYNYKGHNFSITTCEKYPIIAECEFTNEQSALSCQVPQWCAKEITAEFEAISFAHC